jgi:vacuolar-type H+-ATPase subunit C/Vma6
MRAVIEAALGRLGAMKTDLLTGPFYARMLGAGSVADAVEMLIGTTYEPAVRRAEGRFGAALERELWHEVFATWIKLVKFLEGAHADLAVAYARGFEIENVRRVVRRILADAPGELVPRLWNLGRLGAIKVEDLDRARTMVMLRETVMRSPYAHVFELAEHRLVKGEPLFAFEQHLDAGYLDMLLGVARSVRGAAGASARAYVERRVHFTNLRWALRLKFGRGVPKDDVPQFLVREGSAAHREAIAGILDCEKIVDAARVLGRALGMRRMDSVTLSDHDRSLRRAQAEWSRLELRKTFFEFASLFAFFDVRAQEVRNIAAVLIGIRQGRPEAEMRQRLGLAA